jgi:asparagine synthase (glutamine-hydrolysing)
VRVPFLNRELAEFVAWNVPPRLKIKGRLFPTTKHIFRKAMSGILPEEVLKQPKAGFAAPTDYWLANDLREMTDDLLSESRVRERGLFRPKAVSKFVDEHRNGKQDWSMQIWQFLTLELWMQNFLDGSRFKQLEPMQAAIA